MVTVDIQHVYTGQIPDSELIQLWAESALQQVKNDCELSIRFVDEAESASLNKQYRGKANSTNVLSFRFESEITLEPLLLGDLVICVPIVEREAETQAKSVDHHCAHLVVHGCLHLIGYNHIEDYEAIEMETLETDILDTLAIPNPYQ